MFSSFFRLFTSNSTPLCFEKFFCFRLFSLLFSSLLFTSSLGVDSATSWKWKPRDKNRNKWANKKTKVKEGNKGTNRRVKNKWIQHIAKDTKKETKREKDRSAAKQEKKQKALAAKLTQIRLKIELDKRQPNNRENCECNSTFHSRTFFYTDRPEKGSQISYCPLWAPSNIEASNIEDARTCCRIIVVPLEKT